jgi:hypothetical protein
MTKVPATLAHRKPEMPSPSRSHAVPCATVKQGNALHGLSERLGGLLNGAKSKACDEI